MDMNRIILGIATLFFSTVIFMAGDPLMHGQLYEMGVAGNSEIANKILTSWNTVYPVFIIISIYLILSGGRDSDYPSTYV